VADWRPGEERLTVHQGSQAPHIIQSVLALHLGWREQQVRVVCGDVGRSFGIKVHVLSQ
jgi:carbon-monoxide dehydrogenase large subunit